MTEMNEQMLQTDFDIQRTKYYAPLFDLADCACFYTSSERFLLTYIARHANSHGHFETKYEKIVTVTGISESVIGRSFRKFQADGILKLIQRATRNQYTKQSTANKFAVNNTDIDEIERRANARLRDNESQRARSRRSVKRKTGKGG